LKTDFGGLPIAFHLTGGEASDSRNFEALLDIGPDINPRAALIALRCEKTAQNYGSLVALALGFILIKSVHTA
jgi:hypothetical protein